ncbi:MAG TPA: 3-isopropylmalate dehydrogenase [Gemmatimonadales bacterium]|nr:3-isopropylmalate dehydrogenase [Gemmatimonadales bacterium]
MTAARIAILPGDGIGPEVVDAAVLVLRAAAEQFKLSLQFSTHAIGAAAVARYGDPFPPDTRAGVQAADAVLLGAVGDPSLDSAPRPLKPESGLLALRALLGVYANLRPVAIHPSLITSSPIRPERLQGTDLLIVRELTGGLYYGEPRSNDGDTAVNTLRYTREEITRVAHLAFKAARGRRRRLVSVDKANVLETSQLWRQVVTDVARGYPDVELEHLYVDYAAMRLVSDPSSIDVLLTENMFGDILSDEAAVLAGSLGLLPSASLGNGPGLYEPIHGSAPPLAGKDVANPIGTIASGAMLLRYSLGAGKAAEAIEAAVAGALAAGARTRDIAREGDVVLGTRAMAERVALLVGAA